MKIVHIVLGGAFNENMGYQSNHLARENRAAGHNVTIIAGCYKWNEGKIDKVSEEDTILADGTRLIRVKFDKFINDFISIKIKKAKSIKFYLHEIRPDVIFFHDVEGYELLTVANYKKNNPNVKLFVDSHSDKYNSATNWISRNILYRLFYKPILRKTVHTFDKLLYISYDAKDFLEQIYNIPEKLMKFYPLGGTVISEEEKQKLKREKREELNIAQDNIVLCHTGKMDYKKRTVEILDNFSKIRNDKLRLILIGTFTEDVERRVMPFIQKDSRIMYLGWKRSDELIKYIAASDLYLQPGSQSATMQNALCAGTPVLFEKVRSHEAYLNGSTFAIEEYNEMESIFNAICNNPEMLDEMSRKAYVLARDLLDYKKMARFITE